MDVMLRTCVIGHGYWGKNIARVVSQSSEFELDSICDHNPSALQSAGKTYPGARLFHSIEQIDGAVDVVAVMTLYRSGFFGQVTGFNHAAACAASRSRLT